MTSAEFDLLLAFCRNPGRVLSREQLLDLTHGGSAGPIERSIDVHVSRVRQKIEPDPSDPSFIKTVRLPGYIFTPARTEVCCGSSPELGRPACREKACESVYVSVVDVPLKKNN